MRTNSKACDSGYFQPKTTKRKLTKGAKCLQPVSHVSYTEILVWLETLWLRRTTKISAVNTSGLQTLEDREEGAQSQTSGCSSQHPQRHVSSVVTLSLLNNNVVHSRSNISTYITQPFHSNITHQTHHTSVHKVQVLTLVLVLVLVRVSYSIRLSVCRVNYLSGVSRWSTVVSIRAWRINLTKDLMQFYNLLYQTTTSHMLNTMNVFNK